MGEEYRRQWSVGKGSDTHKYISIDVLQSRYLHVRPTWLKEKGGQKPAGKMILRINLSRSFAKSGRGDEDERLRRWRGFFMATAINKRRGLNAIDFGTCRPLKEGGGR